MAVIQEAWIGGVSTRRVDELVQAMGLTGISKSTVSKLCRDIDERVGAFAQGIAAVNVHEGGGNTEAPPGVGLRWPSDLASRVELRRSHP